MITFPEVHSSLRQKDSAVLASIHKYWDIFQYCVIFLYSYVHINISNSHTEIGTKSGTHPIYSGHLAEILKLGA